MENPDKYVGHIVRLKPNVFQHLIEHACRSGIPPDNCFLVATASRRMRKLICYNADLRVTVSISDVALV
ncbi:MAG: hypothetical protein KJ634_06280 [Gammaproteobacteria bacterium]|nr:hypothetical protein [Gammaproteobacteria bacterium]MBU1415212.1 hypothetical protein [Gammaproteobacteria bacterium]